MRKLIAQVIFVALCLIFIIGAKGCMQWRMELPISENTSDLLYSLNVTMNDRGDTLAAWLQYENSHSVVFTNLYTPILGWRGPKQISETNSLDVQGGPQIALDSYGNGMAVWMQEAESGTDLYNLLVSRYDLLFGWSKPKKLSTATGSFHSTSVQFDSRGNAMVIWGQPWDGTNTSIWACRYDVVSGWQNPENVVYENANDLWYPCFDLNNNGVAIVVWTEGTQQNGCTKSARYMPVIGWSAPETIGTSPTGYSVEPAVAINSKGNAVAVWMQAVGDREDIWANKYTVNRGWGQAVELETEYVGESWNPQVVMDDDDNAHAVWSQYDGSEYKIFACSCNLYQDWETAVQLENNEGWARYPKIVRDGKGNAYTIWSQPQPTGAYQAVWGCSFQKGSGWGQPEIVVSNKFGNAKTPELAMSESGVMTLTWVQTLSLDRTYIYAKRYE